MSSLTLTRSQRDSLHDYLTTELEGAEISADYGAMRFQLERIQAYAELLDQLGWDRDDRRGSYPVSLTDTARPAVAELARRVRAVLDDDAAMAVDQPGPAADYAKRDAEAQRTVSLLEALTRRRQTEPGFSPRMALNLPDAAAAVGVSVSHFQRRVQPGLRTIYSGKLRLFPVKEIDRWLEENSVAPVAAL